MGWFDGVKDFFSHMTAGELNEGEDAQIAAQNAREIEHLHQQLEQERHDAVQREFDHAVTHHADQHHEDSAGHHPSPWSDNGY